MKLSISHKNSASVDLKTKSKVQEDFDILRNTVSYLKNEGNIGFTNVSKKKAWGTCRMDVSLRKRVMRKEKQEYLWYLSFSRIHI